VFWRDSGRLFLGQTSVWLYCAIRNDLAKVAELVDALDLGSSGATRESSSLSFRTNSPRAGLSGGRPRNLRLFEHEIEQAAVAAGES
jgi:hypothetical protein